MQQFEVRHAPEQQRFVVELEGQQAVLDYRLQADVMAIVHTGVPEAIAGRGVAGALTAAALAAARAHGWQVSPECSYAAAYLRRHPEYQDLLR